MLKIILFCGFIALVFAAETRVKVGSKRWAFKIETNHKKNVRTEHTDKNGIAFGTFSFVAPEGQPRQLKYRFNLNRDEPDISFDVVDDGNKQEEEKAEVKTEPETPTVAAAPAAAASVERAKRQTPPEGDGNNNTIEAKSEKSEITISEPDWESIDGSEDFSGHVSLKVGKSVYFINFMTGDKSAAREEAFDENGMIYGKYTYVNLDKHSKVVVNYKFNSTGSDPTFEVSLYKKNEPNRTSPVENESNPNTYYNPNWVDRRAFVPSYHRQLSPSGRMPTITLQSTNPPHNIITPRQGNWYYRLP